MAKEQFSRTKPHVNVSTVAMNLERAGFSSIGAAQIANGQMPIDPADQATIFEMRRAAWLSSDTALLSRRDQLQATIDALARQTTSSVRQIELIQPKLIVAMGRFAAQTLLNTDASIASLRGRVHQYAGRPLIVTYHPAYLLRNLPDKSKAWQDLVFARRTMASL